LAELASSPGIATRGGSEFLRWCLVAAIAGIGMTTRLKEMAHVLVVLELALLHWPH
jgi:hypothetical protein